MLIWIEMIVVLAALVVLFSWLFAKMFGRGGEAMPMPDNEEVFEYNRGVVGRGDINDIMFETVLRGYRQDQVDDVIAHLKWQVDSLTARLEKISHPSVKKAVEQDFSTAYGVEPVEPVPHQNQENR